MSWNDFEQIVDCLPTKAGDSILVVRTEAGLECEPVTSSTSVEVPFLFGPTPYLRGYAVALSLKLRRAWWKGLAEAVMVATFVLAVGFALLPLYGAAGLLPVTIAATALWADARKYWVFAAQELDLAYLLQEEFTEPLEFCELASQHPAMRTAAEAVALWFPYQLSDGAPRREEAEDDDFIYDDPYDPEEDEDAEEADDEDDL